MLENAYTHPQMSFYLYNQKNREKENRVELINWGKSLKTMIKSDYFTDLLNAISACNFSAYKVFSIYIYIYIWEREREREGSMHS